VSAEPEASPPLDEFSSRVLDVVDSIPPGRVMSYGDIAEYLGAGMGPRQVGRVMSAYGGAVAWWRVIHADGTPAPGHDSQAVRHYLAEGTPLRSARPPVRVDMRQARWPGRPLPPRPAVRGRRVTSGGHDPAVADGPATRLARVRNQGENVSAFCWNRG